MHVYSIGQRWISDTESELGLGLITFLENRRVTVQFPATDETRTYADDNAPLTRLIFDQGDRIEHSDGWFMTIDNLLEDRGMILYRGHTDDEQSAEMHEGELNPHIRLQRPKERLLAGRIDKNHWFELRHQTLKHQYKLAQSPTLGLTGARIDLLPHQLYIAHEVGNRSEPRVLLADEVGLGKTIEACLILHHQLITGRANRVIIIVPNPLLHQWLMELMRRFNLYFNIFDDERCNAIESENEGVNPFFSEQLVLCTLELFNNNPKRTKQLLAADWDLMILDEAHHLEWSEQEASLDYLIIQELARLTPSALLLTATPEQLGKSGHFARLRLLDPDRFHDLHTFLEEEESYQPIAKIVQQLLSEQSLSQENLTQLQKRLTDEDSQHLIQQSENPDNTNDRQQLVQRLMDYHGTGRILFRNTRAAIKGFPERIPLTYPLSMPEVYEYWLNEKAQSPEAALTPEMLYREQAGAAWWHIDPRVDWLIKLLKQHRQDKILLICAHAETAMELAEALRVREGIQAPSFHEGMSIIERDRSAAWFAEPDDGSQLLICSEIGSEGRNFQFSHHLVLFDLPLDPDLLEQRIGRLDRIGQKHDIKIHLPYFENTAQQVLIDWYHLGLDALSHHSPAASSLYQQLQPMLMQSLESPEDKTHFDELLQQLIKQRQLLEKALREGRDQLLELNSCRPDIAQQICENIEVSDHDPDFPQYLNKLFSAYGVEHEEHSAGSFILHPGNRMHGDGYPGLPEDGLTYTYHRNIALSHEDRHLFTWEHPLVRDGMTELIDAGDGNSAVTAIKIDGLKGGAMMLETIYVLEGIAPAKLQLSHYLPPTPIRLVLNSKNQNLANLLSPELMKTQQIHLKRPIARKLISSLSQQIEDIIKFSEQHIESTVKEHIEKAKENMQRHLNDEIHRLTTLANSNPNVRQNEIDALIHQKIALDKAIQQARVRLDAVRLIVTV